MPMHEPIKGINLNSPRHTPAESSQERRSRQALHRGSYKDAPVGTSLMGRQLLWNEREAEGTGVEE
jgi:hypothetical protein